MCFCENRITKIGFAAYDPKNFVILPVLAYPSKLHQILLCQTISTLTFFYPNFRTYLRYYRWYIRSYVLIYIYIYLNPCVRTYVYVHKTRKDVFSLSQNQEKHNTRDTSSHEAITAQGKKWQYPPPSKWKIHPTPIPDIALVIALVEVRVLEYQRFAASAC